LPINISSVKIQKNKDDQMGAQDDGGPSKEFMSEFFSQIPELHITPTVNTEEDKSQEGSNDKEEMHISKGKMNSKVSKEETRMTSKISTKDPGHASNLKLELFNSKGIPNDDTYFRHIIDSWFQYEKGDPTQTIELFCRTVGRIQFYCLSASRRFIEKSMETDEITMEPYDLFIPVDSFPRLYRYYFLHGITPLDPRYPIHELKNDVIDIMASLQSSNDDAMRMFSDIVGTDDDESDPVLRFRKTANVYFIESRKIALDAWKDGLSLGGNINLPTLFRGIPMDYIDRMIFAAKDVTAKAVLSVIQVVYDESIQEFTEAQKMIIQKGNGYDDDPWMGCLPELLRAKETADRTFMTQFVRHCTGSDYMPHPESNPDYHIIIEFNNKESESPESLPVVHTCSNVLKLPGSAYNGSYEVLEDKLLAALAYSKKVTFDMS
jgi:HECT-domain (ubiquitin-transferase)